MSSNKKKKVVKKVVRAVVVSDKKVAAKKNMASKRSHKKKPSQELRVSYLFSDNSLTVSYPQDNQFETRTFDKSSSEYGLIKAAIQAGKFADVPKLASAQIAVKEYVNSFKEKFITLEGTVLKIDGVAVPAELGDRIMAYAKENLPYMDLVKFFRNLNQNPSNRAVEGLFRFLDRNHFPLTPEGFFIAYKGVTSDFKDLHTRTFDNSVGQKVRVDRNQVDEDPSVQCARGLHAASYSYALSGYGSQMMIEILINPKDVVCVPFGDNDEKMRVCEYKVLGISKAEIKEQRVDTTSYGYPGVDEPEEEVEEEEEEEEEEDDDDDDLDDNSVW